MGVDWSVCYGQTVQCVGTVHSIYMYTCAGHGFLALDISLCGSGHTLCGSGLLLATVWEWSTLGHCVGVVFSWSLCGSGLLLATVWEWSTLGHCVGVVFSWSLCGSGLLLATVWEWSTLGHCVGVVFSWPLCGSGLLLATVWEWPSLGYTYLVYDSSLAQGTCACTCSLTREG